MSIVQVNDLKAASKLYAVSVILKMYIIVFLYRRVRCKL